MDHGLCPTEDSYPKLKVPKTTKWDPTDFEGMLRNTIARLGPWNGLRFSGSLVLAIDEKAKRSKKVVTQTFEGAQKCLETNYYGAKHVTQALLPLVLKSSSPRIVNVSSKLGKLKVSTLSLK
ncbi:salutaridine reductase-like protein [Tanacetum coccineum]